METGSHIPFMPIDTLAIAKKLQSGGVSKEQAEIHAEVFSDIINHNLATKTDIESLRKDTKTDIENLRKDTKTDIENLRKDTKTDIENLRKDIEGLRKDTKTDIENLRKDTKTDIENLRKDTKTDIENLRKDLTIEISKIKVEMLKWMVPMMAGQLMAAAGLMKIFIK